MNTSSLAATALALLAVSTAAQEPSAGALIGTPAVMIVEPGTGSTTLPPGVDLDPLELHGKPAGFEPTTAVGSPFTPSEPDFSADELFATGMGTTVIPDALSLGLDDVLATAPAGGLSFVAVPAGAWGSLLFSVTPDSGAETSSTLATEAAGPGGAAADLFTLMLPGSTLPASVAACYPTDASQRAADAFEMGLLGGTGDPDIGAVDIFVHLYRTGPPIRGMLDDSPTVYFSLRPADVAVVPPAWFGVTAPSAATILRRTWDPVAGAWDPPVVHLSFAELGLAVDDDVDALAVDADRCMALFSIAKTATSTIEDQLQVVAWPKSAAADGGATVGDYVVPAEGGGEHEPVASRAGMSNDGDVDGTCTIDPGGDNSAALALGFGSPVDRITPLKTLPAGLYRDVATAGLPTLTSVVSNVPTLAVPSQLELWAAIPLGGGGTMILPAPLYTDPLLGLDPESHREVSIPTPVLATFFGASIDLFWVMRPASPKRSSPVIRIEI